MPALNQRVVRNWWIQGEVDGVKTPINTGPRRKDGGFYLNILQRSEGHPEIALRIEGLPQRDGRLILTVEAVDVDLEFTDNRLEIITER